MTENQEALRILQGKKGRYQIIKRIGKGGFGYTFLAEDLTAVVEKRYCVVKQLRMDVYHHPKTVTGIKKAFEREARVLEDLGNKSGNIPSLYDYFSVTVTDLLLHIPQEFNFLVQQYIEGEDLGEELKQQGLFSETKVLDLLKNILPVLKFIHNNNVIHRDIKPSNIIRSTEEENKFYLIDFGAVKQVIKGDIDTKETSIVFGDKNYAPPEQRFSKQVNASSDLYALAATCVQLLTGELPDNSRDVNKLWNWQKYPHISEHLGKILRRMLQKDRHYRYQSATEVIEALNKIKPLNKPDESPTDTEIDPSDDTKRVIKPRTREVIEPADKRSKGKKINSKDDTKVINPNPFLNFIKKLGSNPSSRMQSTPVTFQKLDALLKAGEWLEADLETWNLMLKLTKRQQEGWLRIEDVKNFPRQKLRKMDQLWVKYSNGKFGFSVQKQIWLELGGKLDGEPDWDTYKKLGYCVSIQEQICQDLGGIKLDGEPDFDSYEKLSDYAKLSDRVGWRQNGEWLGYDSYIFSTNAPSGHLPALWQKQLGSVGLLGWLVFCVCGLVTMALSLGFFWVWPRLFGFVVVICIQLALWGRAVVFGGLWGESVWIFVGSVVGSGLWVCVGIVGWVLWLLVGLPVLWGVGRWVVLRSGRGSWGDNGWDGVSFLFSRL